MMVSMSNKSLLSPKELALAIGVSESTLKRWADEGLVQVSRTAGGHRRIPLPEALRFVRETKATIVRPDLLDLPELAAAQTEAWSGRNPDDAIFEALKEGDSVKARGLILSGYLSGRSLAALCDGPIKESMHRLGDLWKHDELGILIEHRATDIIIQALNQLRSIIKPATVTTTSGASAAASIALGGAAEHDPYILPSLMCATLLSEAGYRDINFGPHTPVDVLIRASRQYQPRLVWYTCSVNEPQKIVPAQMIDLADTLLAMKGSLIIGGRGIESVPLPDRPNVYRAPSMGELVAFARGKLAAMNTSAT